MASSDGVDASVGFLYRERDPKKRQVKPVQKHLIQVDFGEEDSDEDSDFKVDPDAISEEEEDVGEGESESNAEEKKDVEHESEKKGVKSENEVPEATPVSESESAEDTSDTSDSDEEEGGPESSSEGDSSEEGGKTRDMLSWNDDDSENDEDYVPPDERTDSKPPTPAGKAADVPHRKEDIKISGEYAQPGPPGKNIKIVICCVCLGDISVEEDEIVECDGCGVSVHEGCYGISDNQSVASTESSASTEPWFCDACKAGVIQPHCELCPNSGGIFKETDAGKWVHIVCALYIPGVAFGDVDKLSPVTLFEMSYAKWGAKECSLCEDTKFSRTGVCVGCDAGMCRNHFHVTCAQREGLLSEASPDEDIADPFYAYCKQHAEKYITRKKRCNWLAIQRNVKNHAKLELDDEKEKERVRRKLNRHCRKYVEAKVKKPPCWKPTEKLPRLLSSCPSALRRLNRKAELLGINTQLEHHSNNKDIRKKSYVSPAFSVDFVSYFVERNNKITNMRSHTNDLQQQHSKLREQEAILRAKYDQLSNEMTSLRNANTNFRAEGEKIWKILGDLGNKPIPLPEVLKVPVKKLTIQTSLPRHPAKKDSPTSPNVGVILHKCSLCHKTSDQHMLARCDKCRLYYHLGCLDPPLTRMPKKTKQCGWQCSECAKTSSDDSEHKDPDAPRKLRETIKEPSKFAPQHERVRYRGLLESCKPKQKGKRKVRVRPSDSDEYSDEEKRIAKKKRESEPRSEKKKTSQKQEKTPKDKDEKQGDKPAVPKRKRKPNVQASYLFQSAGQQLKAPMECVICLKPGDTSNMVRCDECTLCYHYGCLDPPLNKSPKRRGYSWHCAACDPVGHASDYNDGYNDTDDDQDEEKPKRKKKKTTPTGRSGDQKSTKKADGVKMRRKSKERDSSEAKEKAAGKVKENEEVQVGMDDVQVDKDGDSIQVLETIEKVQVDESMDGVEVTKDDKVKDTVDGVKVEDDIEKIKKGKVEVKVKEDKVEVEVKKSEEAKVKQEENDKGKVKVIDGEKKSKIEKEIVGVKTRHSSRDSDTNSEISKITKGYSETSKCLQTPGATPSAVKKAQDPSPTYSTDSNDSKTGRRGRNGIRKNGEGVPEECRGNVLLGVSTRGKKEAKLENVVEALKGVKGSVESGKSAKKGVESSEVKPEGCKDKGGSDEKSKGISEGIVTRGKICTMKEGEGAGGKVVSSVKVVKCGLPPEANLSDGKSEKSSMITRGRNGNRSEGAVVEKGKNGKIDEGATKEKTKEEAAKMDRIINSMCSKELKVVVNRDLGDFGIFMGKSDDWNQRVLLTPGKGEGNGGKLAERVGTRAGVKHSTRNSKDDSDLKHVWEDVKMSERAKSASPSIKIRNIGIKKDITPKKGEAAASSTKDVGIKEVTTKKMPGGKSNQ